MIYKANIAGNLEVISYNTFIHFIKTALKSYLLMVCGI